MKIPPFSMFSLWPRFEKQLFQELNDRSLEQSWLSKVWYVYIMCKTTWTTVHVEYVFNDVKWSNMIYWKHH